MRSITYIIREESDGKSVYQFLKNEGISLKIIRKLKADENGILLSGKPVRTIDPVHCGDELKINITESGTPAKAGDTLPDVIYEDEDLLIVNKEPTMAIHESHNHQLDALSNCVALHLKNEGKKAPFRAIGRLDKGTSGIVVCALNSLAAAKLNGKICKRYLAIATGTFEGKGTIDAPIFRPDPMKTFRTVDKRGEYAITHWQSLATYDRLSLLSIRLETGRTHQIRVHFQSINAPLLGDNMYGGDSGEGIKFNIHHQCLHCAEVSFIHPVTNQKMTFTAPMPQDMQKIADMITNRQ